jgi:TPR repeat protein
MVTAVVPETMKRVRKTLVKQRITSLFAGVALVLCLIRGAEAGQLEDGLAAGQRGDYATAMRLLLPLADQGSDVAEYNLGVMYHRGLGLPRDYAHAAIWYRKAADHGNVMAQVNLGALYVGGQGVTKDYAQALAWFQKAADKNVAVAQNNLGAMYEYGQGVPKDYAQAAMWYRKAADQGYALGQNNLGNMYANGRGGVTQDYAQALTWYRKAADQGNPLGQNNLGDMYANGRGVREDYAQALTWYRRAADQGNAQAQHNLGVMYAEGHGVAQDYAQALAFFQKAADQGFAPQPSPEAMSTIQQPMRFVRVRSNDPACQLDCAEWISAQGKIEVGSAQTFASVIAGLNGRRLPILVNSPGGSAFDALAIGRLIRAKHLAVAVARTQEDVCAPPAKECGEARGAAVSIGAVCASACPLILAGGVERYASPLAFIGVHQMTLMVTKDFVTRHYQVRYRVVDGRREEISRNLTGETHSRTTTKQAATPKVDTDIASYLNEMGVGPQLMAIIYATPATDSHWLSAQEVTESSLITVWIDESSAIDETGANGLAGVPVIPSSGHKALIRARGSWPFALPVAGRTVGLEASFAYRRGGAGVRIIFTTRDWVSIANADVRGLGITLTLTPGNMSYHLLKPLNGVSIRTIIPLSQFCKLSHQGRITVEPFDGPATDAIEYATTVDPHEPPIAIDVGDVAGMSELFEEACPSPSSERS